jgi:hypothetical protein
MTSSIGIIDDYQFETGEHLTNLSSSAAKILIILFMINIGQLPVSAQENEDADNWDNQLFVGNKVAYGLDKWKYSGELQFRVKNDMQALDNWFVEGAASYLPSKFWELVPDFRFSVKSSSVEYRPGFGLLFKLLSDKWQFVNQVKYQADISSRGTIGHGVREVIFLNRILSEKFIPYIAGGVFYRWRPNFSDFEFIRVGGGLNIVFDPIHTLNLSYFVGLLNNGNRWTWSGIPLIQFTINIREDWLYVPAKYINF